MKAVERERERERERVMCRRAKMGDWFWGGEKSNESVIFVAATPRSVLKRRYQEHGEEVLEKAKLRMTVTEVPGASVKRRLQKSDPFMKKTCRDAEKCMYVLMEMEGDAGVKG